MTHKSARTIAKIAAAILLGALAGLAISLDPEDSDGFWINVMGGVIGLGLMILIYEGVWRLMAWPMRRRVPASRDDPPIAIAYGVVGHPLANPQPPQPRVLHGVLLIAVYFGGMALIWLIVGGVLGVASGGDSDMVEDMIIEVLPGGLLSGWLLGVLCVWLAVQWLRNRRKIDLREVAAWHRPESSEIIRYLAVGVAVSLVYVAVAGWLVPLDEDATTGLVSSAVMESLAVRLAWAGGAIAVAPFVEEYLFRGVLFGTLIRKTAVPTALTVSTVPFVLLHMPETGLYWPALLGITSMALLAAFARLRSGKLAAAIAVHFGYNLILVVVALTYA